MVLVGCGGSTSSTPPSSDSDPISDAASPTVTSAVITEKPHRPDTNGIALSAISGDGNVVASINGPGVPRCGLNTLTGTELPLPPDFAATNQVLFSLSNDGLSFAYPSFPNQAILHRPSGDVTITPPNFEYIRSVDGVSGDGTSIVGTEDNGSLSHAFRWSPSEGFVILEPFLQLSEQVHAISNDGRVVVGGDKIARRWVGSGSGEVLAPKGYRYSTAVAVSADGNMVAGSGYSDPTGNWTAYRWAEGVGLKRIGHYPGFSNSVAKYMSADGKVIVGEVSGPGQATPFIWTSASGMKLLRDLEPSINALLMNPDQPIRVSGLSADGKTVVGGTYDRTGSFPEHAWVASITLR